jgi:hypothetical protein
MNSHKKSANGLAWMSWVSLLLMGFAAQANAQIPTLPETTVGIKTTGGIVTVPNQTVSSVGQNAGNAAGQTIPTQQIVACMFITAGCTQGPGPVTMSFTQQPVSVLPGVSVTFNANALGNSVYAQATYTAGTTNLPVPPPGATYALGGGTNYILNASGSDDQLNILYTGGLPLPANVGVDMNYTIAANVQDNSTGAAASSDSYVAEIVALLSVADWNTLQAPSGSIFATGTGYEVATDAGTSLSGFPSSDTLSGPDLLTLAVDTPYVVSPELGLGFYLGGGDFSGLDVTVMGSVDPTFTIDPNWLAENPEYTASDFTISLVSTTTVAEPPSVALFALGAAGLVLFGRRRFKPTRTG